MTAAITGPEARRWTFGYFLLFMCLGLNIGVIGPTLPALAEQTGTPLGSMGLLFLVSAAGHTIGTTAGGRVIDRVRRGHLALGLAQIVVAAMLILAPLAPTFGMLLAVVGVKGIAEGMMNTGSNTLLFWTHGARVGPYMNGLHFFFGMGAFASPFLVAQVAGFAGGYRWAYWILAGVAVLAALRVVTLAGQPRAVHDADATREPGWVPRSAVPLVVSGALFLFFYVGAEVAFGGWVYTYALMLRLADAVRAAYLTSAFWLAFTVGRLVSIPLAARFRPTTIVLTGLLSCLAILALAVIFPQSPAVLWIVAIGVGFSMAPLWPTGFTLAGQSMLMNGRLTSIILLGDSTGAMVLPSVTGRLIEAVGPQAMIYLVFGSLVFSLISYLGMLRWGTRRLPALRPD